MEAQAVATVKQREMGLKYRGKQSWGSYGLSATLFQATVDEYDYDQTRTLAVEAHRTVRLGEARIVRTAGARLGQLDLALRAQSARLGVERPGLFTGHERREPEACQEEA